MDTSLKNCHILQYNFFSAVSVTNLKIHWANKKKMYHLQQIGQKIVEIDHCALEKTRFYLTDEFF